MTLVICEVVKSNNSQIPNFHQIKHTIHSMSNHHHTHRNNHLLLLLTLLPTTLSLLQPPPPLPLLPIPTTRQINYHHSDLSMFLHFGPNTFTDSEWGDGASDPSIFSPARFDPRQWVNVAHSTGFTRLILTAKHHDGFCLWPTEYTDYSVRSSSWRDGSGDVVSELSVAAMEFGVELGLYLSPWDRHEDCYGQTLEYNQFYLAQITELLTRYGEIKEVFLDGAKGEGEKDMEYLFDVWFDLIHQLQPGAVIFSDAGPDVRWVGDEAGVAGSTCWSPFNRTAAKIGDTDTRYEQEGDQHGHDWVPAECDVSIRPGWFWHASESPKSALTLLDIYYKSVGRNCKLLLNVPPNSSGLISEEDIRVLQEFSELRTSIFSVNLAKHALVTASSTRGGRNSRFDASRVIEEGIHTYWAPAEGQVDWILEFDLGEKTTFNVVQLQEPIQLGQRIISFYVEIVNDEGEWHKIVDGTTIGHKRLLRFSEVQTEKLRLVIVQARADPLISYFGVHMDPYSDPTSMSDNRDEPVSKRRSFFNRLKDVIHHPASFGREFTRYGSI
ncbi:hypothetical protein RND81_14G011700 [Saponaria officinalis]|uniref:alpha-L-fucosidase n=1 Tax=Saponaria officinalis TaxID=3572 RepID=A0AAW1GGW4_SAPOF